MLGKSPQAGLVPYGVPVSVPGSACSGTRGGLPIASARAKRSAIVPRRGPPHTRSAIASRGRRRWVSNELSGWVIASSAQTEIR